MNFELATKLKDAAFPQRTEQAYVIHPQENKKEGDLYNVMTMQITDDNDPYANLIRSGYTVVSRPSLPELIEACGEDISGFRKMGGGLWCADAAQSLQPLSPFGSTPEEAVAKLWLALHTSTDPV